MSRSSRTLLILAVIVGTTAAALWIIGSQRTKHSTSILIKASPERVFACLSDLELRKQWVEGLVKVTPVGDITQGVGAKTKVTHRSESGREYEFDNTVIRYDEHELLSIRQTDSIRAITSIYRLEKKDDGNTYLTFVVRTANIGLGRFVGPFLGNDIEDKLEVNSSKLKQLVESSSKDNLLNALAPESGSTTTVASGSTQQFSED